MAKLKLQKMGKLMENYLHFNDWLKQKFGERTLKICIDGGFTCPNRDGTCGFGGCIFCGERGAGENTKNIKISEQVINHLNSYKGLRANKFIAYFQNFTNTYADLQTLKQRYDSALLDDRIVALAVATRPDCINEGVAKLLTQYMPKYYVYVELGLQTASEEIGRILNRGYETRQFIDAVKLLKKYGIDVVVHIMVGLPNETEQSINETIDLINSLNVMGIKIHSTYVIKDTKLEKMYNSGEYFPISLEDYVKRVGNIISRLNSNSVVCRISGDAPKNLLVAPEWNLHKKIIINSVNKYLLENNLIQGHGQSGINKVNLN